MDEMAGFGGGRLRMRSLDGEWLRLMCFGAENMENGEGRVLQRMGSDFWREW